MVVSTHSCNLATWSDFSALGSAAIASVPSKERNASGKLSRRHFHRPAPALDCVGEGAVTRSAAHENKVRCCADIRAQLQPECQGYGRLAALCIHPSGNVRQASLVPAGCWRFLVEQAEGVEAIAPRCNALTGLFFECPCRHFLSSGGPSIAGEKQPTPRRTSQVRTCALPVARRRLGNGRRRARQRYLSRTALGFVRRS